jgi:hypothetical protein
MKSKAVLNRIKKVVQEADLSPKIKKIIFKDIKDDGVIPMLYLGAETEIELTVGEEEISIQIGPRDMQWDLKTGEFIGSGTYLG